MLRELSSSTLAAWGNAWLSGHTGLDDAVDMVERRTGPHTLGASGGSIPGLDADAPLRRALAGLRSAGLEAFMLCLPVPGDPLGLVGTPELNTAAIEARESVLLRLKDGQLGMVPAEDRRGSSYVGVRWIAYPASSSPPPSLPLAEAEQLLAQAIRDCTTLFGKVDDTTDWGPEVTRALADLRNAARPPTDGLPPGYPPRAHRVAALADRLAVVVELIASDVGGRGLSSSQMQSRAEAIRLLDRAVRRARVAAYSAPAQLA